MQEKNSKPNRHLLLLLSIINLLADVELELEWNGGGKLPVLQTAAALATSFIICKASTFITKLCGIQGGVLPVITAIVVILATLLPSHFRYLTPSGNTIALVLMQVTINKLYLPNLHFRDWK